MWTSNKFEIVPRQFNFSSSGQGNPVFSTLHIDGQEFLNMIEQLDGEIKEDQTFQAIICEHCGIYECAFNNWMAIRQINDLILFIPAFEVLRDKSVAEKYEPPEYLRRNGAFWLRPEGFEKLKQHVPAFSKLPPIKRLNRFELISLYKWDLPLKMFGEFPDFQPLKTDQILTTSEANDDSVYNIIEQKLAELESASHFNVSEITSQDGVVSLFFDDIHISEWRALYSNGGQYGLLLGGRWKIDCLNSINTV